MSDQQQNQPNLLEQAIAKITKDRKETGKNDLAKLVKEWEAAALVVQGIEKKLREELAKAQQAPMLDLERILSEED